MRKDNTYDKNDPIKILDVSILQDNLLEAYPGDSKSPNR